MDRALRQEETIEQKQPKVTVARRASTGRKALQRNKKEEWNKKLSSRLAKSC